MKVAIITGGNRGLGKSMVLHLSAKGYGVTFTYRSHKEEADHVVAEIKAKGGKVHALALDLEKIASFDSFREEVHKTLQTVWARSDFDFLVNNAGVGVHAAITDTSVAQFDQLMTVHLKAPFFLTQKLLPLMKEGGRIINISSGLARFSYPGYAVYAMMKGGLEVMTRYLAKELGSRKIAVNTIAPGAIETDFGGGVVRDNADLNKMIASQTALGRVGRPEDIGGAVVALLSDENGWVNGQRIEVSGGIHL